MTVEVHETASAAQAALRAQPARTQNVAIIRRHVADAAFYWTQSDAAFSATHLTALRAEHFAELLEGNLEGLEVAGFDAWPLAYEALARWQKPGEAFVAFYAALALPPGATQAKALDDAVLAIARAPDLLLRGAISALAWRDTVAVREWIDAAAIGDNAIAQVAALRAAALHGWELAKWPQQLQHADPFVRAAACRSAPAQALSTVQTLTGDFNRVVRAEAALAWARVVPVEDRARGQNAFVANHLWRCVVEQLPIAAAATGWNHMQVWRRLDRWLRHLAWLVPPGDPGVAELLRQLPARPAMQFVLQHGDPALLPFVVQGMRDGRQARWAGWVWQCLTGVSLRGAGLTLPDPPVDPDAPLTQAQYDADHGLPLPDATAVAAHPASALRLAPRARLLGGQPVDVPALRALVDPAADQPQALRSIAAHALSQLSAAEPWNLRASPETQAPMLARLGAPRTQG